MRFSFATPLVALLLLGFAGSAPAWAQAPSSPTPPAAPVTAPEAKKRVWLLENHDRLVSVREKDGPPLYAQVITTDNLVVTSHFDKADAIKQRIAVTLKDGNGKKLKDLYFPTGKGGSFDFAFSGNVDANKVKTGGTTLTITDPIPPAPGASKDVPKDAKPEAKKEAFPDFKTFFIIGSDNWLVSGNMDIGKDKVVMERHDMHLTATYFEDGKQVGAKVMDLSVDADKGALALSLDGKEVAVKQSGDDSPITLRDEKGEIIRRTIKQDGKDYTEFTIGERKIVVEGVNWKFSLKDGVMTLLPSTDAAPPAAAKTASGI